jgi:peptide deformylase
MILLPDTHPSLHTAIPECDPDFVRSGALVDIAAEMLKFMRENNGIGLAANQVGLSHRLFVMQTEKDEDLVFINPRVLDSGPPVLLNEGCLTYPDLFLNISRPSWVTVEALNVRGEEFGGVLLGRDARCFSHELDHLDGVTMTDLVSKLKLSMAKKRIAKRR